MTSRNVDFAVFGVSPLACLVAGLLAERHGKTVAQIAPADARYRLPRGIDLSVAPLTRPQTWSLLTALIPETHKLLMRIAGRSALRRLDPIFFADHAQGQEALGHISQIARAYGILADRLSTSKIGSNRAALRLGDALLMDRPALVLPLEKWLAELKIPRVAPEHAALAADGGVDLSHGEDALHADRAIFIDDDTILQHLPPEHWPASLERCPHASILAAARHRIASDVMISLDTGLTLMQVDGGSVAAFGAGALAPFSARLALIMADRDVTQQIGQSGFDGLISADGAPVIGPISESAPLLIHGLGSTGAFMAPMLVRWLVGQSNEAEADWCNARRPIGDRLAIAEFAPNIGSWSA